MLPLPEFKLERYFAKYEFSVKYLLSPSDCESVPMAELVHMADDECRQLWRDLRLGYTESAGHPLLRAEIARLYPAISPEQIVVAAPEELIFLALHSLLRPGDHVLCVAPAYQSLYEVARAIGCEVDLIVVQPRGDGWAFEPDQLRRALKANTRLLIVNFPHNPTGHLPSPAEWEAVLQLAREHGLFVFSDEMYRGLELDGAAPLPPACQAYEKGISLSGLSKTFGLPGLRIGWLATPVSGLPARWLALKDYTTICNSAPSEVLALGALRSADRLVARCRDIVQRNVPHAERFFAQHARLFRWLKPRAGSIAFPRWLGDDSVDAFCQQVLDECGIMILPASIFDYPAPHFRVGLGRASFAEVVEQLDAFLQARY